jgi:hypothetical protein
MNPVGFKIIYHEDNGAYGPGKGISPEDYVHHRYEMNDNGNVSDT